MLLPKFSSLALLLACALVATAPAVVRAEEATKSDFFPSLEGWKQGAQNRYGPDTLYVPIDGAADLFLRYNFEEMNSVEYGDGTESFTVEAYRHATPLDAFGIYSQGRPAKDVYLEIGVQAYAEADSLNLLAGQYYVEMRAPAVSEKTQAAMETVARLLAAKVNDQARFPAFFSLFPAEGRKAHTEKYITQDILGYAFLKNAFQVDYEVEGRTYTLFALRSGDEAGAAAMLKAYLREQKRPEDQGGSAFLEIEDKFQGKVGLLLAGRHLLCAHGSLSGPEMKTALETLRAKILQAKE